MSRMCHIPVLYDITLNGPDVLSQVKQTTSDPETGVFVSNEYGVAHVCQLLAAGESQFRLTRWAGIDVMRGTSSM
jgi:hypothetical protein